MPVTCPHCQATVLSTSQPERVGDTPDDVYDPVYDEGITYAIRMLADLTGSKDWQMKDGSEDHETDVRDTIMDVLKCAGLYDDEDGEFAALAATPAVGGEALANEINDALDRYINTPPDMNGSKALAGEVLQQILWDNKAGIISYLRSAAPSASPLRGREWPKEEIEPGRFVDVDPEVLELTNCFNALLLIERGLDEPLATRIAAQWQQKCTELAILRSASPPEQPAAAPDKETKE